MHLWMCIWVYRCVRGSIGENVHMQDSLYECAKVCELSISVCVPSVELSLLVCVRGCIHLRKPMYMDMSVYLPVCLDCIPVYESVGVCVHSCVYMCGLICVHGWTHVHGYVRASVYECVHVCDVHCTSPHGSLSRLPLQWQEYVGANSPSVIVRSLYWRHMWDPFVPLSFPSESNSWCVMGFVWRMSFLRWALFVLVSDRLWIRCTTSGFKIAVHIFPCPPDTSPALWPLTFILRQTPGQSASRRPTSMEAAVPHHGTRRPCRNVCCHPRLWAANIFQSSPGRRYHRESRIDQFQGNLWLPCSRIYEPM